MWVLVMYAREADVGDLANHLDSTPLEQLAEDTKAWSSRSLPHTLRTLATGTKEQRLELLLQLHRRLYHRPPAELRQLLRRSGVPIHVLTLVDDACALCNACKQWQVPGTRPSTKTRLTARFGELVLIDLIFYGEPKEAYLFMVDDSIRFTTVTHLTYRSLDSILSALREGWIKWFGAPSRLRSDRESALARDQFGVWCESQDIKRELFTVGREGHGSLAVLDRRVQLFKDCANRLTSS